MVTAFLFISGCGAQSGSCEAVVDLTVLRPDGSVYGSLPNNRALAGPAAKKSIVLLSQAHLAIRIEPRDPLGTYSVNVVLRERGTGRIINLKQVFSVVA